MDLFSLIAQRSGMDPIMAAAAAAGMQRQRGGPLADPSAGPFAPQRPTGMGAPAPQMGGMPEPAVARMGGPLAAPGDVSAELAARGGVAPAAHPKRGVFDRIGDFMGSDQGKAALLRAGAATMQGGLGAGVMAGADYVDGQKKIARDEEHYSREMGQRDRGLDIQQQGTDQSGLYQAGQLQNSANAQMLDALELKEAIRKNQMGEVLTQRQQDILRENNIRTTAVTARGQDVSRANALTQAEVSRENNIRSTSVQARGQDLTHYDQSEDRAWQYGSERTTTQRDADGNAIGTSEATIPAYGDIRQDPTTGKYYRLDPATGAPVEVQVPRQFRYGPR
jgi:hypothetical protein